MLLIDVSNFCKKIADSVLSNSLRSPFKKELEMRRVHYKHVSPDEYCHLIDMYFKLEMKLLLEKIIFAHTQGSFYIPIVEVA